MKLALVLSGLLGSALYFFGVIPGTGSPAGPAPVVSYYGNGQMRASTSFVDGMREGPAVEWYADGQKLAEGRYQAGLREGDWTFWLPGGEIDRERTGTYVSGKLVGG
jgi:antitoxin component YwqK of YwqJK toxin-antitoxin module